MSERFDEVQYGRSAWYWDEGRPVEVLREWSGGLYCDWPTGVANALPAGPRCLMPEEVEALQAEVERLKGELSNQECDTAYWKERADLLKGEFCALQVEAAYLRNHKSDEQDELIRYPVEIIWRWNDGTTSTARAMKASYNISEFGPTNPVVVENMVLQPVMNGYVASHPVSKWLDIDCCFIADALTIKTERTEIVMYGAYLSLITSSPVTIDTKKIEIRCDRFRIIEKNQGGDQ